VRLVGREPLIAHRTIKGWIKRPGWEIIGHEIGQSESEAQVLPFEMGQLDDAMIGQIRSNQPPTPRDWSSPAGVVSFEKCQK